MDAFRGCADALRSKPLAGQPTGYPTRDAPVLGWLRAWIWRHAVQSMPPSARWNGIASRTLSKSEVQ